MASYLGSEDWRLQEAELVTEVSGMKRSNHHIQNWTLLWWFLFNFHFKDLKYNYCLCLTLALICVLAVGCYQFPGFLEMRREVVLCGVAQPSCRYQCSPGKPLKCCCSFLRLSTGSHLRVVWGCHRILSAWSRQLCAGRAAAQNALCKQEFPLGCLKSVRVPGAFSALQRNCNARAMLNTGKANVWCFLCYGGCWTAAGCIPPSSYGLCALCRPTC